MEQGLGDAIQFIRYAPLVKGRGATVFVECPPFMIPLFSTCPGIDAPFAEGASLPDFDAQAPVMSLPYLCGTPLSNVPNKVPHLFARQELVDHWRRKLDSLRTGHPILTTDYGLLTTDFLIGICWQGNPHHPADRHRSIPLHAFAPLAKVD